MKMKNDHRSKFSNLSNWKEEAWKNQGFNGIRTRNLRDTGAMLYQLSYEATHWERGQFIEFISSRGEWNDVKFIWNNSYMNCGCRWKWRMIIAVNFPICHSIAFDNELASDANCASVKELQNHCLYTVSGNGIFFFWKRTETSELWMLQERDTYDVSAGKIKYKRCTRLQERAVTLLGTGI